jgi:molybdopterin-biosynthesis enzyme MoeA-like protein
LPLDKRRERRTMSPTIENNETTANTGKSNAIMESIMSHLLNCLINIRDHIKNEDGVFNYTYKDFLESFHTSEQNIEKIITTIIKENDNIDVQMQSGDGIGKDDVLAVRHEWVAEQSTRYAVATHFVLKITFFPTKKLM